MGDPGHPLPLKLRDRICNEIAQLDAAYALITPLDTGRLALYLDGVPDSTNGSRLYAHAGCFTADATVVPVAAHNTGEGSVAGQLLVHHVFKCDISLETHTAGLDGLDRHRHGSNA